MFRPTYIPLQEAILSASASLGNPKSLQSLKRLVTWILTVTVVLGVRETALHAQETVIANGATWRWRKGTNEVSNPTSLWRSASFNDSTWPLANAPFHFRFANNVTTGDDGMTGGTILTDMRNSYRCVFLRRTFVITNVAEIQWVTFAANYDDGYVAWINGTEIARANFNGSPAYNSNAGGSIEPSANNSAVRTPVQASLSVGTNVLAIQTFNNVINGSDFRINASLQITKIVAFSPPVISSVAPPAQSTLGSLTQATVTFSEPVTGVSPADFLVNEQPASAMTGTPGTNRYVFTFAQPLPGLVNLAWSDTTAITDLQGAAFDPRATNASWSYVLADVTAPEVTDRAPVGGATVSQLPQVEVRFNEPVFDVSAGDLLINGQPAAAVTGAEVGPYVFTFPAPGAGTVNIAWAAEHGIRDIASNIFAGGDWSVTLNPTLTPGDVVINEFVAGNTTGLTDEDGERVDWIEIHNRGTNAVNLLGWSLTENADVPGMWTFPSKVLNPGQYLVVFASGKDRRAPAGVNKFHTNFRLDLFGEYLALFNAESPRVVVSEFTPQFPEQRNNYSYGRDATNAWRYFQTPTPEAANGGPAIAGIAADPHFSIGRGFFDAPFTLLLTTAQPGGTIRYTLDGSEPTAVNGLNYTAALVITNTTMVRAAVLAPNYLPSRVRTHSYLYLDNVLSQPANPPGFPATWGTYSDFSNNIVPADYAMDLDPLRTEPNNPASPVDPDKLQRFHDGLRELPVVSIVMDLDDIFNPSGLYHTPNITSKSFPEKPCSVEMVLPDGSTAFAVTGGLGAHGNASREPRKNPKHGFKLSFKGEFGESSLRYPLFPDSPAEEFDDLIIRADFGSSWRHQSDTSTEGLGTFQRSRATRTRDAWFKDTFRDMGQIASHNRFCHLFINGLYWGTYDFTEQANASFAPNYYGGTKEDYDVYEQGQLKNGTSTAYNAMTAISGLANNANYELMKQYLDVPQHIDSIIMHLFIGHQDWGGTKNWYALRKRESGPLGTYKYLPWDGENLLLDTTIDRDKSPGGYGWPSGLHGRLIENSQYLLDFADRVHKHMIAPDGALTPPANIARWAKWMAIMDKPIVAESMRWGDYRRDVHSWQSGNFQLYNREDHWLVESNRIVSSYLPGRNATVLSQFRRDGYYPSLDAPEFRQTIVAGPIIGSGPVAAGFVVALRNPGAGTIYYTTNGSDPRVYYSGTVATSALTNPTTLTLNSSITLKARVLNGTAWSALNEATFTVGELGLPLRITEIMYNPSGGDPYEFLEIQNVGALPLDLSGFSLQGLTYVFPASSILPPGATLLVANNANPAQFSTRYPSASVFGYFGGTLANGGERVAILNDDLQTVMAVHYDDENGWPTSPDGGGFSLEIIDPRGDPNSPANWRASSAANGTPGLPPVPIVLGNVLLNEVMADNVGSVTNAGAFPDWIELHNRGGSPTNIAGWSLTDDSSPRKFVFPANTTIPAGGFLVIWCDTATNAPGLHTGFALGKNGETVSLFDANTNRADALNFGLQLTDYSVGRVGGEWQLTRPTPVATNIAAMLAVPDSLSINEWLANSPPGSEDWIELFNRSSNAPVALRGLHLGTSNVLFRLGALSFLAPRGYVQLFADELPGPDHLEFKLPANSGVIALYNAVGSELERVTYGDQTENISAGRLPDGATTLASFPGSSSPEAGNYLLAYTGPHLNEILARNGNAVVSPWGNYADYVELHNPGGSAVELAGMALGDSADFGDAWIFPAGASIPGGGRLVIWCDSSRAASTSSNGPHNAGFNLSSSSGSVCLFNPAGQVVDSVAYGFQIEDVALGRAGSDWRLLATPSPGAANSTFATLGSVASLRLNEWMAAPLAGDDWFEIYNADSLAVDLSGLYLTDHPSSTGLTNSPVAPLSFIGGRKWVRFVANGNIENGADHVRFSLDALGETLRLYDTNRTLIDVVDFGVQTEGVSQGRLPDGAVNLVSFPTTPTPGAANYLPLTSVVINEVLTHTDAPLEDAVELFNPTASDVSLGGWYLSDSASDLKRYRIPDGTVVPAGGFKVFYQAQFGPADGEDDVPPLFSFNSAHGDAVHLSQADAGDNLTGYRASISFDAATNGVSFGRHVTSVGVDFVALNQRTFGVDNPASLPEFRAGTGESNAYPRVGPVVIHQIMYHPADLGTNAPDQEEFLELRNLMDSSVSLFDPAHPTNRWRLANAVSFVFPADATIPAGGSLVIVPFDPATDTAALAAFQSHYGANATLAGPYSGKLDNAGDSIELWRPDAPQSPPHPDAGFVPQILVERVIYSDTAPWPTNADGRGFSLQRLVAGYYGNEPLNWKAALPTLGSPDFIPPAGTASLIGDGIVRLMFSVQIGRTYQMEYKTNLSDVQWLPLGAPVPALDASLTQDDNLTGQTSRFYRMLLLP